MADVTLDAVEVRVLGSLVEKELTTPDYYPMTLNALTAACNQKSNREPVVSFEEEDVLRALESLQRKRLAGTATAAYSRVPKYRHALAEQFGLERPALAALSLLMLRGPQTVGEIRGRAGRLYTFETLEQVERELEVLVQHEPPLATLLPRLPGQKEQRYAHLLAGEPEVSAEPPPVLEVHYGDAARIQALEEEVAALRDEVQALAAAFRAFREQFE